MVLGLVALALCLLACRAAALAQSADLSSPSPVTGPEIAGVIAPLDIGDSRLTRHFYTFGGGQGDVELTIDSNNLEGDIDIFAAAGLRPLTKITLYPGLNSGIARTVYLRRAETLVLRVQARSPNDSDGSYRIRLGGTFVPAAAASVTEPAAVPQSAATGAAGGANRKGRRVSSVGARIEEPKVEVAVDFEKPAAPDPTPEAAAPTERPTPARRGAARTSPNTRTPARTGSTRRGTSRGAASTPAATPAPEGGERTEAASEAEKPAPPESAGARPTNRPRGRASRSSRARPEPGAPAAPAAAAPAPTGLELPGTRLVLELREGGQFVREMAEVRRVTIERGHVVVLLKSGRAERYALSNVLRMSIEP